ncbi:hypothetical protein K7432_010332 [Basidiobolus ranarum]|uniref:Uncharacterized protein n=1 Tax=Basidiobolus ranarum TaxID=34480 RepID=A0ABR2WP42_9FUNG
MTIDYQSTRYEEYSYPPTHSAVYYEDVYYHLYAISQKKLLSITESRIDQGVRKAVLINNLFRHLPPSQEGVYIADREKGNYQSESVPTIELEEQSWFDSCLEDLHDDEDEYDNSDEEMEWSWSSSNAPEESFMDYDSSSPQSHATPPYYFHQSKERFEIDDPHAHCIMRNTPGEPQSTPNSLATTPQENQAYLSRYFCRDSAVPSNDVPNDKTWSGNSRKFSLGCYSNHLFYL